MDVEDASPQFLQEYANRLARLAEHQLDQRLSSRLAPEDIVQSVFRTYLRRHRAGKIQIDGSLHLWRLLVRITILKCRAKRRQHFAARRDVNTETGYVEDRQWEGITAGISDEQVAVDLLDLMEVVLRDLPSWYADASNLRLQGYSVAEAAEKTGRSKQSVYRALDVVYQRLTDLLD